MKAWIVRDRDETLYIYFGKPKKAVFGNFGECRTDSSLCTGITDEVEEFSNVRWADEEPTEVEISIKN